MAKGIFYGAKIGKEEVWANILLSFSKVLIKFQSFLSMLGTDPITKIYQETFQELEFNKGTRYSF